MTTTLLAVVGSVVFLVWAVASEKTSHAKTQRFYASYYTPKELREIGRNEDGSRSA